jgi:hypothetical protein
VPEEITAVQAARILQSAEPSGPAGRARRRALGGHAPPGRPDPRVEEELAIAVKAPGTSLTGIFGAGPVIAATVIGDVARFSFTASGVAHNGGHSVGRGAAGRPVALRS